MPLNRWLRALGCIATAIALAGAPGCASQKTTTSKAKVPPSEIKIYATPDLLNSQFTLVQHVWIDSWSSNFTYPSFSSQADGYEAMKRVASDAGANGLIHVLCIDTRSKPSEKLNLNCYGDAIWVN